MKYLTFIVVMALALTAIGAMTGQQGQQDHQEDSLGKPEIFKKIMNKGRKLADAIHQVANSPSIKKVLQKKDAEKVLSGLTGLLKTVKNKLAKAVRKQSMMERMSDPCEFNTQFNLITGSDGNTPTLNFSIRANNSDRECNMAKTWVRVWNKTSDAAADFTGLLQLCPPREGCDLELDDFTANATLPDQEGAGANLTITSNFRGTCNDVSGTKQIVEVKRCGTGDNDFVYHLPDSCRSRDFCASGWDPDRTTTTTATARTSRAGGNTGGNAGK